MSWQSLTISLTYKEDAEAFEDFLLELGAVSITYSDAGDEPILEPDLDTTPLWSQTYLTALFQEDVDLFVIGAALVNEFGLEKFSINDAREIKNKTWEREWLKYFEPMRFGRRLWVCPSDMPIPVDEQSIDDVVITLDPGLAFGTGTHETTALCLEELDRTDISGMRVLDYGCGSGILALAAHKLGAREVVGVDIDPQAITATLDNAERNDIDNNLYVYVTAEDDDDDISWNKPGTFDLVVANILSGPLVELSEKIASLLKPEGHLILSGIMQEQAQDVLDAYHDEFELDTPRQLEDWVCITGRKKQLQARLSPSLQQSMFEHEDEPGHEHTIGLCPYCDHQHEFSQDELDFADGKVRCENCHRIFNAYNPIAVEQPKSKRDQQIESHAREISHFNFPSLDDALELDVIGVATAEEKTGSGKFFWLLLSLLGLAALLLQLIHHNRSELALHPKLGPVINQLYSKYGLELEPDWQLEQYKTLSNAVSLNPNDPRQLVITSVLQNTADFAQPYPILRLSLQNRWGESIAYKDFYPSDYLEDTTQKLLAAKQTQELRLAVLDPGNEAMDYQSDICLEFGTDEKIIRCQSDY